MADTVQQIKDRLSITDVVSQYVKLDRAGNSLRARCPFHAEKTPSFFVSPERGTWHCFGCNQGGDIFTFVEQIEGLDFKGALRVLAEKAGVPLVYERRQEKDERGRLFELMEAATIFYSSRLSDESRAYLKGRGLTEATVREFRLGWAGSAWSELSDHLRTKKFSDKEIVDAGVAKRSERGSLTDKFRNRIMFPVADPAGRVVAFSGRLFGEHASPEAPKYLNSPETPLFHKSRILYGFDRAKSAMRKVQCAVLVEGQMDLVMSHQAGWGNTVALSGTAFAQEHGKLIKRMTDNLVVALDADPAGVKAAARTARVALQCGLNVKIAQLPEGLDPADLILKEGEEAWRAAIRQAKDIITFLLDVLERPAGSGATAPADRFRRVVEQAVLPFLSDVASPIARAQYVRQVAQRLRVPEAAVAEALQKLPQGAAPARLAEEKKPASRGDRARQAFALLLWQRSLPKPQLDLDALERDVKTSIGGETWERLFALPAAEQEALRFLAERLYGGSRDLAADARELTLLLRGERLLRQLAEATRALEEAETAGESVEISRLEEQVRLFTEGLAQLHKDG